MEESVDLYLSLPTQGNFAGDACLKVDPNKFWGRKEILSLRT